MLSAKETLKSTTLCVYTYSTSNKADSGPETVLYCNTQPLLVTSLCCPVKHYQSPNTRL